jgi:zinc-ribbon domain
VPAYTGSMASVWERVRSLRPRGRDGGPQPPESAGTTDVVLLAEDDDLPAGAPANGAVRASLARRRRAEVAAARAVRRERAVLRARYVELRDDLGGLLVEMARRRRFNHPLLERRADDAVAIERRLAELDAGPAPATVGAPELAAAPLACGACGAELPQDARFCAQCGAAVGS